MKSTTLLWPLLLLGFVLTACGDDTNDDEDLVVSGDVTYKPQPDPQPGDWLAFRADPARTGHNPMANTGRVAQEIWRIDDINTTDYGAAKGSPSVEGDVLYVGTDDARFMAVDRMTGDILWQTTIPDTTQGIHGSPAIYGDRVFIGAYNGTLYAFDKLTGAEDWSFDIGFQVGASPVVVPAHGRIYNTHEKGNTGGGHIVAVDLETGAPVWVYNIQAHPHSSVAVHQGKDILVVGDNLALLHGIDTRTGNKVWEVKLPEPNDEGGESDIKSTPTVLEDRDLVVVGAWSKFVHAYNIEDGTLAWQYDAGSRIMSSAAYDQTRGVVYVGTFANDRGMVALNADTGEELWRFATGGLVLSSPAINADGSLVVFGSHDGALYAVDAVTGEQAWRHDVGSIVSGSPALVGNHVYVTAYQGDLVALETGE